MKVIPLIYLAPQLALGSHGDGWQIALAGPGLPAVKSLVDALPKEVFESERLGLLISDALTYPMRVALEEKVNKAELAQFLTWKMKRYLPWPADQVSLRYLPLSGDNNWLTFSLPTPWLNGLYAALAEKGVACGFMGGAFTTLLENQSRMKNHANLCFFEDCFLMAELDAVGNFQTFSTRRLPFEDNQGNNLDVNTLHSQDLAVPLGKLERPLQIFNFAPELESAVQELAARISGDGTEVKHYHPKGNVLQRLQACLYGGEIFV